MKDMFAQMIKEEDGQGMVEYGLIIAGIALVLIVSIGLFGGKLVDLFESMKDRLVIPV